MKRIALALALILVLGVPVLTYADGDHSDVSKVTATQRLEEAKARMELIDTKLDILNLAHISTQREIEALNVIIRIEGQLEAAKSKKADGSVTPEKAPVADPEAEAPK